MARVMWHFIIVFILLKRFSGTKTMNEARLVFNHLELLTYFLNNITQILKRFRMVQNTTNMETERENNMD